VRLVRDVDGREWLGDGEGFVPLAAAVPGASLEDVLELSAAGDLPASLDDATAGRIPAKGIRFVRPLDDPGKLWGVGLNYADHAADLDESPPEEPASFLKPSTAFTGPGGPIRLPPREESARVTAEAELGVVVGRTARDVAPEAVDDVVAGYVPVIDATAEDVLERNPRFLTRAKSYDTFLVLGPWIETDSGPLAGLTVRTVVDGEVRAEDTVDNTHFSPAELVAFHSRVMTLEPGDMLSTGTPGAHPVESGDRVRAEVEDVGTLEATVVRGA
jgi:2-keto-4-pentenoate hydratase/2-oxohepta-3-ene-1,7-dioic acid hydratase in catechol pathway